MATVCHRTDEAKPSRRSNSQFVFSVYTMFVLIGQNLPDILIDWLTRVFVF